MRLSRWALAPVAVVPLLLAGCSGSSGGESSGSATSSSASSASSGPATGTKSVSDGVPAAGWGSQPGCVSGSGVPAGAAAKPSVDVDGDGRPDTAWIGTDPGPDGVPFGVATAAGGGFSSTIQSASPVARSVLLADVTGHGEVVALASDGRQVLLYGISGCSFVPIKNPQGQQYAFDLGFTGFGTGVGCVDANGDGTTDLVGLKVVDSDNGEGTIQRTVIELDGSNARNGATDSVPVTRAPLADEARTVTCGDLTLDQDGVTSGP
jgi:hypothetical protein